MAGSNINLMIKRRLIFVFCVLCCLAFLLIVRLGYIQLYQGSELQKLAIEQWTNDVKIDAKRGKILDRNGNELALSASCERVDAYMRDIIKAEEENQDIKDDIASKLAPILNVEKEYVLKRLNLTLSNGKPMNSVTIKRRIDKSQADEIRKLKLPGIIVSEDSKRFYPNGSFLSHVLGFTDTDGKGQEGLELKYDEILRGTPGRIIMEADARRRELPYNISKYEEPVNGRDLVLTIDESIQLYVEKALEDSLAVTKAKAATAIVMDPTNGDILAMATKPDFDPNDPRNMKDFDDFNEVMKLWNNRAVTYTYEPGSIFKVVTAIAALSEGIVNESDRFVCNGNKVVADRRIKCWKRTGHGVQDFAQILQNSCNVGFMELGEKLGKEKLYKYIEAFGLGKPTGIDVQFEESGYIRPLNKVGKVELANISFGQGITVTPIQMASVFSAIANDGIMMKPRIVKEIQLADMEGNVIERQEIEPQMLRKVADEDIARKLREYLELVISEGGGRKAYIEGYHIGGKTGTAQKVVDGRYASGKYVASFVGMAPIDNPKFVVYVSIDEPDPSNYYASQTAAPLAQQIFKDIFVSRNIVPDIDYSSVLETLVPNVIGLSRSKAEKELKDKGFDVQVEGEGKVVVDMNPIPGLSLKKGSKVILYMGNGQNYNDKVIMPNLEGKDAAEVSLILESLGLKLNGEGQGFAVNQSPKVGKEVKKGTSVNVEFEIYGD